MIKIENVKKTFDKNIVLKNVNLSIKKGEIQALLGANGAHYIKFKIPGTGTCYACVS